LDFVLTFIGLEVEDSEVTGGSATSEAEIGGGGGIAEVAPVLVVLEMTEECIDTKGGRVDLGD